MHDPEGRSAVDLTGAIWRKSTRSGNNGGACVEVASLHHVVAVRDSKDPGGPKLALAAETWRAFAAQARAGAYDT